MRPTGFRSSRREMEKKTTPHLWGSATILFSAVVLVFSCSSTPAPQSEDPPIGETAVDPTPADAEASGDDPGRSPADSASADSALPDQRDALSERNRNLAAQAAELAADNRFLRSRVSELESDVATLREENSVLLSLVDDILLAQGVLRASPPQAEPRQPSVDSTTPASAAPAPSPPTTAPAPSAPAEPSAPATSTTDTQPKAPQPPVLVRPSTSRRPPADQPPAETGDESPVSRRDVADEENTPSSEAAALPAPADPGRLDATRAMRESNLRFRRDEKTGTVQYVDSRIAYDAANVAYLSVQALPGRNPTMHLHLRATAPGTSRSLGIQTAVLNSAGQEIRLDASNSTTIRRKFGDRLVAELVAPVTPALFETLRQALRAGGSVSLQGLAGSRTWDLTAVERAAMTNILYAFQDLGGTIPR